MVDVAYRKLWLGFLLGLLGSGDTMLNVKKIENEKPRDKAFKLSDGGGLFLYVAPSGTKSGAWRIALAASKRS